MNCQFNRFLFIIDIYVERHVSMECVFVQLHMLVLSVDLVTNQSRSYLLVFDEHSI